jgi:glycerol-3-phosphate dehydrogenase
MNSSLPPSLPEFDVVVVGGGVNGTGVARDCALRGLKVALLERNDLGFGASGNSTGFIHGGPRYLTQSPGLTEQMCRDSGVIQRIAPHLLFRVPVLLPVLADEPWARIWVTLYDAFFRVYDRYQPLKRGLPHTRLTASELRQIEPSLVAGLAGGVSFDEWGIDGVRLCVANALDASRRGALVRTHCTVTRIVQGPQGRVTGVLFRDQITGETGALETSSVVSATGAWAPLTARLAGLRPEHAAIRPGKGIHVYFDRRLSHYALVTRAIDGRQVFVFPWQNSTVVGTTDDDYYGDLDDVVATHDEVRYLLQAASRVIPSIAHARAIGTWAGVRPTLHAWGPNEDALSREHRIVDHAEHGVAGFYSMLGGKLSSYRLFAEQMTDILAARLGNRAEKRTHVLPLPGADQAVDVMLIARLGGIDAVAASRLAYRHGSRALQIIDRMLKRRTEAALLCACEPVTMAEVRFVVEQEFARSVHDVARRTRLGLGACGGMRCVARCAAIVAEMTGRGPREGLSMARDFWLWQARRRWPAMNPAQARQEALTSASLLSELGPWRP